MVLGLLTLDLSLPGCNTLKEKRHRLRGVIERVRTRFNISASEVDHQDLHQSALVAVAMVSQDRAVIEKAFARVEEHFANGDGLVIAGSEVEWF
jgi:hypothetical protein